MTKQEYTELFVSEDINYENKDENPTTLWGQLDDEKRKQLDYNHFRSSWVIYRNQLNDAIHVHVTLPEPDSEESASESTDYLERMTTHLERFYNNDEVEYTLVAMMQVDCVGYDQHEVFQIAINLDTMIG